jgi:hypothetical protein
MARNQYVLVANASSNSLSIVAVDDSTGLLTFQSAATGDWPVAIAVLQPARFV